MNTKYIASLFLLATSKIAAPKCIAKKDSIQPTKEIKLCRSERDATRCERYALNTTGFVEIITPKKACSNYPAKQEQMNQAKNATIQDLSDPNVGIYIAPIAVTPSTKLLIIPNQNMTSSPKKFASQCYTDFNVKFVNYNFTNKTIQQRILLDHTILVIKDSKKALELLNKYELPLPLNNQFTDQYFTDVIMQSIQNNDINTPINLQQWFGAISGVPEIDRLPWAIHTNYGLIINMIKISNVLKLNEILPKICKKLENWDLKTSRKNHTCSEIINHFKKPAYSNHCISAGKANSPNYRHFRKVPNS